MEPLKKEHLRDIEIQRGPLFGGIHNNTWAEVFFKEIVQRVIFGGFKVYF